MSLDENIPGQGPIRTTQNVGHDFMLSKWYLDCVSEKGEAFVGYAATLRWKGLELQYSSVLVHSKSTPAWTRTTLRQSSPPDIAGDGIHWSCPSLKVDGHWTALSPPIARDLIEARTGALQWRCYQPHARASIHVDRNHRIQGFGYVERIDLSIPPWQLNINTLRWGRFLCECNAVVWIKCDGCDGSQSHVFFNGNEISDCSVADTGITLERGRITLALRDSSVLREGTLVSTALSMIPGITRLLPKKILRTHECKWLSKGRLIAGEAPPREGWAIHEVVNFL